MSKWEENNWIGEVRPNNIEVECPNFKFIQPGVSSRGTQIFIAGKDISRAVKSIRIESSRETVTTVFLEFIPAFLNIEESKR